MIDLARVAADVAIVADLGGYAPYRRPSLRQAVAELQALPALKAERDALAAEITRRRRHPLRNPARPAVEQPPHWKACHGRA